MMFFLRDLIHFSFLQNAVLAGLLASIACGIVGSFVVVRRSTYIAGAVSHSLLAGMGFAMFLNSRFSIPWMTPMTGAVFAAFIVSIIITWVKSKSSERMDTVLSSVWSIGMAVGVTFIAMTPGYNQDLMSFLFGNILMVSNQDLILMFGLDLAIVAVVVIFYNKLLVISFHREFAELKGINVLAYEFLFLLVTSLTIVLLLNVVGIVLVIALLTLPAAVASKFSERLSSMIVISFIMTFLFISGGLIISYGPDWPPGPTIIELAGITYLLTLIFR